MRRLLVAGLAALAVVLGLVISMGVASAAVPADGILGCTNVLSKDVACDKSTNNDLRRPAPTCTSPQVYDPRTHRCETPGTGTPPVCVSPQVLDTIRNICVDPRPGHGNGNGWPGNGNHGNPGFPGGYGGGWHPGLPWGGPALYGHQVWVDANLGLDICGYAAGDYNGFISRNAAHRDAILRALGASPQQRWLALHQSDCRSNLAVIPGGLTLVNGNLINLDLLGLQGAGTANVCSYADYNVFSDHYRGRFGNRFDSVRGRFGNDGFNVYRQLRVNAHCTTIVVPSSTTIVQDPGTTTYAAPAPSGNDAASDPAPVASAPLPAIAPVKAPSTGGWDTASLLAHARVA